jgi:hypothetical protein
MQTCRGYCSRAKVEAVAHPAAAACLAASSAPAGAAGTPANAASTIRCSSSRPCCATTQPYMAPAWYLRLCRACRRGTAARMAFPLPPPLPLLTVPPPTPASLLSAPLSFVLGLPPPDSVSREPVLNQLMGWGARRERLSCSSLRESCTAKGHVVDVYCCSGTQVDADERQLCNLQLEPMPVMQCSHHWLLHRHLYSDHTELGRGPCRQAYCLSSALREGLRALLAPSSTQLDSKLLHECETVTRPPPHLVEVSLELCIHRMHLPGSCVLQQQRACQERPCGARWGSQHSAATEALTPSMSTWQAEA